jgi:CelD/BcsL family acetyltransferase involved in cellulose biosynthesis
MTAARGSLRIELARTDEELARLEPAFAALPWQREEAAYEYFTTRLRTRPDVIAPFAAVVFDRDTPVAGYAGRIESRRLDTALGYKVVYAPEVRFLRIVDGGLVAPEGAARRLLLDSLAGSLQRGEADVLGLPPFDVDSSLSADLARLAGPLERQPFIAPWTRRQLVLPATFEEFLASRSHKTRKGVRQDARRLETAFGERLTVEIVRDPAGLERFVRDADRVAGSTYQRALGGGFADTAEQRALIEVGLEHGWVRGYLLHLDGEPIAYWLSSLYGDTMLLKTGGYDHAHTSHRVGIYLLMRVIEDACLDPTLRVLDYGPGDAGYKQQFSNESVLERNLVLFAPTFRARRINATRTAILGPARVARVALDRTGLTDRLRSGWRRRMQR